MNKPENIFSFWKPTDNRLAVLLTKYRTIVDFRTENECHQTTPLNIQSIWKKVKKIFSSSGQRAVELMRYPSCPSSGPSADPEGEPGVRTPPLRFVEGGVSFRGLMGKRGGPTIVLPRYYLFFWLASLASIMQTYYMYTCSKFNGTVILSLYFPYPNFERNQLPTPCLNERAFSYCSCPELHEFAAFKQQIFWGWTARPPSPTLYISKITMSSLCVHVERGMQLDNALPKNKLECKELSGKSI